MAKHTSDDKPVGSSKSLKRSQSSDKTAVSKLQEYCQHNDFKIPEYEETLAQDGSGYSYTVLFMGKSYKGPVKASKQEAKQGAAEVAYQQVDNDKGESITHK